MTNDLVKRLRMYASTTRHADREEAADRIEELERHIELRDWFLVENDLWEKFAKGAEGKTDEG